MKHLLVALAALAATSTTACGFEPDGAPAPLAERLARRAYLDVTPASTLTTIAVAGPRQLPVAATIDGGTMVLRASGDGYLLLEDLTLALAEVPVPAGFLDGRGFTMTELTVHLGTQAAFALPAGDDAPDALASHGRADLILDWSMRDADGRSWTLGSRRAPQVDLGIVVGLDPTGAISARVTNASVGTSMAVTPDLALTEVTLQVVGEQSAPPTAAE